MKKTICLMVCLTPISLLPFYSLFPDSIETAIYAQDSNTILSLSEVEVQKYAPQHTIYEKQIEKQIEDAKVALQRDEMGTILSKALPRLYHAILSLGGCYGSLCGTVVLTGFIGETVMGNQTTDPGYVYPAIAVIAFLSCVIPFTIEEIKKTYNYHGFLQKNLECSKGLRAILNLKGLIPSSPH